LSACLSCFLFLPPFIANFSPTRERIWLEQQLLKVLGRLPYKVDEWSEYELMERISGAQEEEELQVRPASLQEEEELEEEKGLEEFPFLSASSCLPLPGLGLPSPSLSLSSVFPSSSPSLSLSPRKYKWTQNDIAVLEASIAKHGRSWSAIARDPTIVFSSPIQILSEKLKVNKIKSYGAALLKARDAGNSSDET
jgi:hypothetical protein